MPSSTFGWNPPRVTLESDGLKIIHLCCRQAHPDGVQTMLSLALQAHLKRRGHDPASALQLAQSCLCAIGATNIQRLDQLVAVAQSSPHPGAVTLVAGAQRQATIIPMYLPVAAAGLAVERTPPAAYSGHRG